MTIGEETRVLVAGDVAVVNRGVEHELWSEGGCEFIEALAPVPLDHVPDAERDLVLGEQGTSLHVAHVGGTRMPLIDVKLYDRRVTEESVPKIIEALTKALAESSGAAPEHI